MRDVESLKGGHGGRVGAALAIAGLVALTVVVLRVAGRVWWCACGTPVLFVADPSTPHNSQHVFDWYSFSHLLHGVIFFWVLQWTMPRLPARLRPARAWWLVIAVAVEAAWEVLENSPIIINRYREATAALGYEGDSIVNSVGDLAFCVAGYFLARAIGWKASPAVFLVVEVVMVVAIRDNLTLNVLMLLWPSEAIKALQMGG